MTNDGGDDPKNKGERMSSDRIAPEDKIWVCLACGKTAVDRYGIEGPRSSGWDESCMLNAVLCERGDIVPGSCVMEADAPPDFYETRGLIPYGIEFTSHFLFFPLI